jgi:hypothetical protein
LVATAGLLLRLLMLAQVVHVPVVARLLLGVLLPVLLALLLLLQLLVIRAR